MFYHQSLNKVTSKLTKEGALQYVHQDPNSGVFMASDRMIMLIENTGTPFIAETWDTITQAPITCDESGPDWSGAIQNGIKNATIPFNAQNIKIQNGYAIFNGLYISAKYYAYVQEFIGPDINILIPDGYNKAIYFYNADKTRQALVMTYNLSGDDVWEVLDASGTIIYTTSNIEEAELFGLTVRKK